MNACKPLFLNPKNENDEFKCDICNKYLSIAPILFNDSVGNVCGRCFDDGETEKFNTEVVFQVQKVYENIAKYIIFPCSYYSNGCNRELLWDQVQKHEKSCDFKDTTCPLSCQDFLSSYEKNLEIIDNQIICEWKGTSQHLVSHLRSSHKNCISSTNRLEILSTQENSNEILFFEVGGIFTVMVLYYLKTLKRYDCNVLMDVSFKDCKMYKYDLEIFDTTEEKSLILPGNNVEPINGRDPTRKNIKNSLEIDPKIIRELLGKSSSMILCFKIMKVFKGKTVPLDSEEEGEIAQEICIIEDLKCFCGNILFSPIYVCSRGHNCCDKCYQAYGCCEKCRNGYVSGRNTSLETIAFLTKYHCKNKLEGCVYVADCPQMKMHEVNCILTTKQCILKCGWMGINTDMFEHIRKMHFPLQLNQENNYASHMNSKCYPILFDNKIFILTIQYTISCSLFIELQCLGMDERNYEFQFSIMSSCNSINLVSTHLCQPLSFGVDRKKISTNMIEYPFTFLTQFITDFYYIKFKINISKLKN